MSIWQKLFGIFRSEKNPVGDADVIPDDKKKLSDAERRRMEHELALDEKRKLLERDVTNLQKLLLPILENLMQTPTSACHYETHWFEGIDHFALFNHVSVDIGKQPEGYFAMQLSFGIKPEYSRRARLRHMEMMSTYDWWSIEDNQTFLAEYLLSGLSCDFPISLTRTIDGPLFQRRHTAADRYENTVIALYIGTVPDTDVIGGGVDYTVKNHEILTNQQLAIQARYRTFAVEYLKHALVTTANDIVKSMAGRLQCANSLQLKPNGTFKTDITTGLLLGMQLHVGGRLVIDVATQETGRLGPISAIVDACWEREPFLKLYQSLLAEALQAALPTSGYADYDWSVVPDVAVSGYGDYHSRIEFQLTHVGGS